MKPSLLVLTTTFPRWQDDNLPPFVYELSRRLSPDFQVHVLTPHAPGAHRFERKDGMEIHRFKC